MWHHGRRVWMSKLIWVVKSIQHRCKQSIRLSLCAGGEGHPAPGCCRPLPRWPAVHQGASDPPNMMKTEPSSATGGSGTSGGSSGGSGNSNLRSPSPHRNAYQAGLAALKKASDHLSNAANGAPNPASKPAPLPRPTGRGRKYGSNVHRIKNMFMQMQSPGDEEDGAKTIGNSPHWLHFWRDLDEPNFAVITRANDPPQLFSF